MAMFGSKVIGNDLLDIGTRKWNEEQGNDDNFRPDIMGAPTSFMVPAVANVSVFFKRVKFFYGVCFRCYLGLADNSLLFLCLCFASAITR